MILSAPTCMQLAQAAASGQQAIEAAFDAFWSDARSRPFPAQETLWDKIIERPRQELYEAVVWEASDFRDWQERKEQLLRRRFAEYPRVSARLAPAARALRAEIPGQVIKFNRLFPDAPARPPIELVLAPNFDAKSGLLANGTPVLVLAVDSLLLEDADLGVIFPHELFHLYHANHAGVLNDGAMTDANLTLPLFAEGLATYVSAVLSPGHSDGQLLLQADLGEISDARLPVIAARFLADADEMAVDPVPAGPFARWFTGSARRHQADLPNRSGYWLGLHVIRRLRSQYTLRELASWAPAAAQEKTKAALYDMAGGKNGRR